jgi:hypothetical protein
MSVVKYYTNANGDKCVDLDVNVTLTVDIKGWSRIFQYSNRDLTLKQGSRLRLYDKDSGKIVAIYDPELDKKINKKQAVKTKI